MNQEELLKRVSLGDKEAFRRLYQETDKAVYSFILSIMKNPQDAEEIMQETYIKIWTSAGSYLPQGKPLAWIFTIARNLCYMRFREKRRMADMGLDELSGDEAGETCLPLENLADVMALHAAFEILKEDERQVVMLHAASGLKHREIAAALGMPLSTVLSKYNRAVKKLKQYLEI
mgnify:CR=1 FL=1